MKNLQIGLFGFGVVGEGIYNVLSQKPQLGFEIKKIVIKQANKKRNAPKSLFSTKAQDILNDDNIDLVVELIDDAESALYIVKEAMNNGKSVISANKKMIAEHHLELIKLSQENKVSFLYEAAVCGSVPIIRNLEEYFDNDLLNSIQGIVNGSTNFILSRMLTEGDSYSQALHIAQESGFAESDPELDVEGIDATYKLSIIGLHAFGKRISAERILRKGISSLHPFDLQYAQEKKCVIKLIAKASTDEKGEIEELSVLPTFIPKHNTLAQTNNEFNGVLVGSALADEQFLYGKGAGRYPTSSAVLSDISAFKYGYKYEFKKGLTDIDFENNSASKFYISFDKSTKFNEDLFETIDEKFSNNDRVYFTGSIQHSVLHSSRILSNPNLSVISCN